MLATYKPQDKNKNLVKIFWNNKWVNMLNILNIVNFATLKFFHTQIFIKGTAMTVIKSIIWKINIMIKLKKV